MHQPLHAAKLPATISHSGDALDANRRFAAPPPAAIGTIRSAFSTHRAGRIDVKAWLVTLSSAAALGLAVAFALIVEFHLPSVLACPAGAALGILMLVVMIPRPTCTYVGEDGLCRVTFPSGKPAESVFVFAPDSKVSVEQQRVRVNGIYTGTEYAFRFSTPSINKRLTVAGRYFDVTGKIPRDSEWHFGAAGESALADALRPPAIGRLDGGGVESFRLSGGTQLDLRSRTMRIERDGRRVDIPYADLDRVEVQRGEINLSEKKGKDAFVGLGGDTIFRFLYSDMPNARLFLDLVERQIAAAGDCAVV